MATLLNKLQNKMAIAVLAGLLAPQAVFAGGHGYGGDNQGSRMSSIPRQRFTQTKNVQTVKSTSTTQALKASTTVAKKSSLMSKFGDGQKVVQVSDKTSKASLLPTSTTKVVTSPTGKTSDKVGDIYK